MTLFFRSLFIVFCGLPPVCMAAYDLPPLPALAGIEGEWRGTLQYRDYQPPHKRVTLRTQVFVTAVSTREVALHYVFEDGLNKIVHSYDRMTIDMDAGVLQFAGSKVGDVTNAKIVSQRPIDGGIEIVAERNETSKEVITITRYRLRLGRQQFEVLKTAGEPSAESEFRNEYVFKR